MLIDYNWLQEYCDCSLPPDEAASELTLAGLNVEGLSETEHGTTVLDVEVTANRNDCNSYLGVARELSVVTDSEFSLPPVDIAAERAEELDDVPVSIREEDQELCPRYTARVVRDVDVSPSPDWLVQRLEAMGLQSVNNIVDITNYVLFETGQPLHAFDLDRLEGPAIRVRRANEGEQLAALNDETYELASDMLVISDEARSVALAGVIGGRETEVRSSTTDLLIESALFDPVNVRRTSRELGVSTESSYRFERGPDPLQVELASRRAARLMKELAGGTVDPLYVDRNYLDPAETEEEQVQVRPSEVREVIGVELENKQLEKIYEGLGFEPVDTGEENLLEYKIPTFRPDIEREEDLIEEAARIYGYDEIPISPNAVQSFSPPQKEEKTRNHVRQLLMGEGYREFLTFPFLEEDEEGISSYWTDEDPVGILNADEEVDRYLRKSMIPSVLEILNTNEGYGKHDLRFFELSKVYRWHDEDEPAEQDVVCMVRDDTFHNIKGDVEVLFQKLLRSEVRYEEIELDALHPTRAAELWLGRHPVGYIGQIHDALLDEWDVEGTPYICEIDYNLFEQRTVHVNRYESFSRYPPSEKDLSFVVDENVNWSTLQQTIFDAGPLELRDVEMFDVFRGEEIPDGRKSVAIRMLFRSNEETLESDQINDWMKQVVDHVEEALPAELRGDL